MVARSRGKRAGIPAPVGVKDPAVERILWAIREHVDGMGPAGRAAGGGGSGGSGTGSGQTGETDEVARPLRPENLAANGMFGGVFLEIDRIPANAAYVEWLAHDADNLANAIVVGTSVVPVWMHYVADRIGRYYWCRGVSYGAAALRGAVNATDGTYAQPAADPGYLKDQLDGEIEESQLAQDLSERIDLIDGPPDLIGSVAERLAGLSDAFELRADAIATDLTTGLETAANERAAEAQARQSAVSQAYGDLRLYADSESAAAVSIDQLIAAFGGNISTALSYIVAEVDDDLAITTAFDSIAAQFGDQQDAINARATIDAVNQVATDAAGARALQRQEIDAEFDAVDVGLASKASVTELAEAVADQNEARTQLGTSIDARFESLEQGTASYATVDQLAQAQADDEGARALLASNIAADFQSQQDQIDAKASVTALNEAVSDADSARATLAQQYDAQFQSVNDDLATRATLAQLAEVESDATTARAALGDQFTLTVQGLESDIQSRVTVTQLTDAIATETDNRVAQYNDIEARFGSAGWIDTYQVNQNVALKIANPDGSAPLSAPGTSFYRYTLAAVTRSTSTTTGLVVTFRISDTGVVSEFEILSQRGAGSNHPEIFIDGDGDVAVRLYGHSSYYNVEVQHERTLADVTAAGAQVNTLRNTVTSLDAARAQEIDQVSTTVGGLTSTIEQNSQSIDGISGQWTVKIDNNGRVSGVGLASEPAEDGTPRSEFFVRADRFAVIDPSDSGNGSALYPFIVANGNIYADNAIFRNASITSAKIQSVAANKVVADRLSAIVANLGEVNAGTFRTSAGSAVRAEMSSIGAYPLWIGEGSKSASNAWLYVDSSGLHAKGDITARRLEADSANIISTLMLQDQAVTFPLGVYTASAQTVEGDDWALSSTLQIPSGRFQENVTSIAFLSFSYNFIATLLTLNSSGIMEINAQVEVDGSVERTLSVARKTISTNQATQTESLSGVFVYPVFVDMGAGSHNIRMSVQFYTAPGITTYVSDASHRAISLIGLKK